jgi:hypothetical protein
MSDMHSGSEQPLPVLLARMTTLLEQLNRMERLYGQEEAARLYTLALAQARERDLSERKKEQAQKALDLLNHLMTDNQERATWLEKRCSYILFLMCFVWLRCCNVPFIMDEQSELYRLKRPEDL